jgi:hypothetical protein
VNNSAGPVELNELKESCKDLIRFVKELEEEKLLFLSYNKVGNPMFAYRNTWPPCASDLFSMEDMFKEEFFKLKVPDDTDLERRLQEGALPIFRCCFVA